MAEASLPSLNDPVIYASSAAFELYGTRAPIGESEQTHQDLLSASVRRAGQISPIVTLFPAETISRVQTPNFIGGDSTWHAANTAAYHASVDDNKIPACVLSLLRNVTVQNAAIYLDGDHDCTMLYEMHRPNDRPSTSADREISIRPKTVFNRRRLNKCYVFIASAGSHNWGHWLTDDLPRTIACEFLQQRLTDEDVTILLLSFGADIDQARRRTLECHPRLKGVSIEFIQRFVAYSFDELYYASPVSFHPVLKLRSAIDYVRSTFCPSLPTARRKIFVTRPVGNVRSLANAQEIEEFLQSVGFEVIECSGMNFEDQVRLFSEASCVIGIMGAAMTNTVFSQPNTQIVQLACIDWLEPFYWDLADACGQRCTYLFGQSIDPHNPPHFARFTISVDELAAVVAALHRD